MKRTSTATIAALLALAVTASDPRPGRADVGRMSADDSLPSLPGAPHFVTVVLDGVAADSVRRSFMTGFRGAFTEHSFPTEHAGVQEGTWLPGLPVSNRFVLLEGSPTHGGWQSQASVEWIVAGAAAPPAGDSAAKAKQHPRGAHRSRTRGRSLATPKGARSDLAATSPLPGARVTYWALAPEAVEANVRVVQARETLRFHFAVQSGPAFYRQVGRRVALLVLESLHHQSEDLDADTRMRLDDCDRIPGVSDSPRRGLN